MLNLVTTLNKQDLYYELYQHQEIFSNEDALVVKAKKGFSGTETKSLFLKNSSEEYFIFFTFTTKKADFKKIHQLTGKRLKIVAKNEMEKITGQRAGAVSPIGYDSNISIIIDEELFDQEKLVFAPGRPDQTMVILAKDLLTIIDLFKNKYYIFPKE
ncbi:prolyl-tRNA editing protein [Tetragenococcus halophilus subsp. flandriensis]|uniref:YbaK/EbsC family protein n=1 Tax=Tetragenococcus halophilus TaxID=51669 RepID=UPI0023E9B1DE|nr:prolyl-tRNA editing protein [Tetragenococcus halophilus subsp. flandriensis]